MKSIVTFWPTNTFLLLLQDKILLRRYGHAPWNRDRLLDGRSYPLRADDEAGAALPEAFARIAADYRPGADDSWYLGLPLRYFTFVDFSLPQAAGQDLEQAVRYALMRHVPFDLETTHVRHVSRIEDGQIAVRATVAPKDDLTPILEAAETAGITVSAVLPSLALAARLHGQSGFYISGGDTETEVLGWRDEHIVFSAWDASSRPKAGAAFLSRMRPAMANAPLTPDSPHFLWESRLDPRKAAEAMALEPAAVSVVDQPRQGPGKAMTGFPYTIGLVPAAVLRRRRISFWVQSAALLLMLLALASIPLANLAGMRAKLNRLDARIAEISSATDALTRMRAENERIEAELRGMAGLQGDKTLPAEVLRELTELLPQEVWLTTLVMDNERIELRGTASSATMVIERIEASPLFKEARFDSPVTKRDDKELFKVLASLERQPAQGG